MKSDKLYECIKYCEEQNGMPVCKNCGLDEDIITEALEEAKNLTKKKILNWAKKEGYKEDFEDIGSEAIANTVYDDKFDAFRHGYNEALKQLIEKFK